MFRIFKPAYGAHSSSRLKLVPVVKVESTEITKLPEKQQARSLLIGKELESQVKNHLSLGKFVVDYFHVKSLWVNIFVFLGR